MVLDWFDRRVALEAGTVLADLFAPLALNARGAAGDRAAAIRELLQRASGQAQALRLNVYKRTQLAKAFKSRLIALGVETGIAHGIARELVVHLWMARGSAGGARSEDRPAGTPSARDQALFEMGSEHLGQGALAEAITCLRAALAVNPRFAEAYNNLGCALVADGRATEANAAFARAVELKPEYAEAYTNRGNLLREMGLLPQSEANLRRALELQPALVPALLNLGATLVMLGRLEEAEGCYRQAVALEPKNPEALVGMGSFAAQEGQFGVAEQLLAEALSLRPKMPAALAAIPATRKMTAADATWLATAEEVAAAGLPQLEESRLRYAMGKYCDDIRDYERAFAHFQRANDIAKTVAPAYDRAARVALVEQIMESYGAARVASAVAGASTSARPVFVVGMMRSGTSLVEQIIASHPLAAGAGELPFWSSAFQHHLLTLGLEAPLPGQLGSDYLRVLEACSADASRVVDKAPLNADYVGLIHTVLPNARFIYMQRDPIDTCLSCYFQGFSATHNYTLDLSDLAHYFEQHHRLVTHWRAVLPAGIMLDVPYESLVAEQDLWSRRIIDFIGLDWDERCLNFHKTERTVATASQWQVRQKIYKSSVERWRNYEKFIGPLRSLERFARAKKASEAVASYA